MNEDTNFLLEWAVWTRLDSETNIELVLLKGHLLLEYMLDIVFERNKIHGYKDYSFYRKIISFEKIDFNNKRKKTFIVSLLKEINQIRNTLAHEFKFDIKNSGLEIWTLSVLKNLSGTKNSKYTYRTKIIHAFSILAINILELKI